MKQSQIIESFTEIYWPILERLNKLTNVDLNIISSKRYKEEIISALKWPLKHCGTLIPPKASENACKIADKYNIDLFALQWKDQPIAEELICGERGRNIFVHEHEIPVSILYKELIQAKSREEVKSILSKQSIVWITEDENKVLPKYIRGPDTYQKLGIIYKENPYGDNWMEKSWRKTSP